MRRMACGLTLALAFAVVAQSSARAHDPVEDSTSIAVGSGKVTIEYGTPKLAGRNLDQLIQPGLAWFIGMNKPTTLETTVALDFGGKKLPAGKYSLFARADQQRNWTLLISSAIKRPLDPNTVVLESPLGFARDDKSQELLKITLEKTGPGVGLVVAWGNYRLKGAFKPAN